jgi:hypothetical protein
MNGRCEELVRVQECKEWISARGGNRRINLPSGPVKQLLFAEHRSPAFKRCTPDSSTANVQSQGSPRGALFCSIDGNALIAGGLSRVASS